jgi:transposase
VGAVHLSTKGWGDGAAVGDDELWKMIEPLIPKVKRRYRYPGRKRFDDRRVLTGILSC